MRSPGMPTRLRGASDSTTQVADRKIRAVKAIALVTIAIAALPAFASPSGVVISGFQLRGPQGGNDEYVEIRNAGSASVSIRGWRLRGCASGTGSASDRVQVDARVVLAPGQYYLFTNSATSGYSGSVPGDATYTTGIADFAPGSLSGI